MRTLLTTIIVFAMLGGMALAQTGKEQAERDLDHARSGVITIEQLNNQLQFLITPYKDVAIHFVLPNGWELVEGTVDPVTGKQREDIGIYVLLSRAPVGPPEKPGDPDPPTDLIFELDIFEKGLLENLPADTPLEERTVGVQMWNFLNEQDSINRRAGMKLTTNKRDLEPKAYGTGSNREPEFFVPLFYETPSGAMLYTFTTFTNETVWMVKFLVAENQTENYGALIALILDNTFGMTKAEFDEVQRQREAQEKESEMNDTTKSGTITIE